MLSYETMCWSPIYTGERPSMLYAVCLLGVSVYVHIEPETLMLSKIQLAFKSVSYRLSTGKIYADLITFDAYKLLYLLYKYHWKLLFVLCYDTCILDETELYIEFCE